MKNILKNLNQTCMRLGLMLVFVGLMVACQKIPVARDLSGNRIPLQAEPGKWLLINYWASWCKPCYEEIPELNRLYETFKKEGITIVGVNYEALPEQELARVVKKMGILYPVLNQDPALILGIEEIPGLPATYLVNDQGKVVKQLLGPQTLKSLIQILRLEEQIKRTKGRVQ